MGISMALRLDGAVTAAREAIGRPPPAPRRLTAVRRHSSAAGRATCRGLAAAEDPSGARGVAERSSLAGPRPGGCLPGPSSPPAAQRATATRATPVAGLQAAAAALGPASLPVALGLGLLVVVGLAVLARQQSSGPGPDAAESTGETSPEELVPSNAVLVVGATGKLGAEVVRSCLAAGRCVVAAGRQDRETLAESLASLGLRVGAQASAGALLLAPGVDISREETLTAELFQGVSQVVSAVGPRFGRQEDGSMGYPPGSSPEQVDAQGVSSLVAAAHRHMGPAKSMSREVVASMETTEDLERWRPLDDVIMGGQSYSDISAVGAGRSTAVWKGKLIIEGGGFCGTRTDPADWGLGEFDGVALCVKGSGQRFKLNLKTEEQADVPESTYQACFDTDAMGDNWTTVYLPWHEFRCVKRASFDPKGPPIDPSKVRQLGLVYSRFEFNGQPNPRFVPGDFELLFDGGLMGYRLPRPQFLMVSSAGVERNAYIGDDAEARAKDIPIVQLNPGGILNFKYEGEAALRASGLAHTIIRPTGLTQDDSEEDAQRVLALEMGQGDRISGKVSRKEVAEVVASALGLPSAVDKTFEVRRSEAADAKGKTTDARDLQRMFLSLHSDWDRAKYAIPPFPRPAEYVPPKPKGGEPGKEEEEEAPPAAAGAAAEAEVARA